MSIDTTTLGRTAAELMDALADAYAGDDAEIGTVAIVVEVRGTDEHGTGWTCVDYRCTDQRRWVQEGFFDAAKRTAGRGDPFES